MKRILSLIAIAFLAVGLSNCGGQTPTQIEAAAASVESQIQNGVATTCKSGIIPTIGSILDVASALTGNASLGSLSNTVISAIESTICAAAPPPASERLMRLPLKDASGINPPGFVGTANVQGLAVPINGWRKP